MLHESFQNLVDMIPLYLNGEAAGKQAAGGG